MCFVVVVMVVVVSVVLWWWCYWWCYSNDAGVGCGGDDGGIVVGTVVIVVVVVMHVANSWFLAVVSMVIIVSYICGSWCDYTELENIAIIFLAWTLLPYLSFPDAIKSQYIEKPPHITETKILTTSSREHHTSHNIYKSRYTRSRDSTFSWRKTSS